MQDYGQHSPTFVGSDFWIQAALAGASILGNAAKNRSKGQREDEELELRRDRNNLDSYLASLRAPQERLTTATRASRAANAQPVKINWGGRGSGGGGTGAPPVHAMGQSRGIVGAGNPRQAMPASDPRKTSITGGYNNPAINSPELRALANDILNQQVEQQGDGRGPNRGGPPPVSKKKKSNWLDKVLGVGAFASSALGAYGAGKPGAAPDQDNEWYEEMG